MHAARAGGGTRAPLQPLHARIRPRLRHHTTAHLAQGILALCAHQLIILAAQAAALCGGQAGRGGTAGRRLAPGRPAALGGLAVLERRGKHAQLRPAARKARRHALRELRQPSAHGMEKTHTSHDPACTHAPTPSHTAAGRTRVAQDDPRDAKVVQHLGGHFARERAALGHPAVLRRHLEGRLEAALHRVQVQEGGCHHNLHRGRHAACERGGRGVAGVG